MILKIFAIALAILSFQICQAKTNSIYIKNVNIVDTAKKSIFAGSVLVEDGFVKKVYRQRDISKSLADVEIFEGQNRYLMAGLHDMHSHNWSGNMSPYKAFDPNHHDYTSQEGIGHDYLYSGVTTYLDLYSPSDIGDVPADSNPDLNTFELRKKAQDKSILHPNIFAAGPIYGVPGTHGVFQWGANDAVCFEFPGTAEEDRACKTRNPIAANDREWAEQFKKKILEGIQKRRPDVIKFVFDNHEDNPVGRDKTMPLFIAKTIIETAKSQGIKTVAHVGTWAGVESLAKIGLGAFTHLPHGAAPQSTIDALKKNNVYAIPTLSVYMDPGALLDPMGPENFVAYPLHHEIAPDFFLDSFLVGVENYDPSPWREWMHMHNHLGTQYASLKSLYEGGVKLLAGTDAGNTAVIFGASLHRELERWADAGVDNWTILQAATSTPEGFLNHNRGSIKPGYVADLILLGKNPAQDIKNTTGVEAIFLQGERIDRGQLSVR